MWIVKTRVRRAAHPRKARERLEKRLKSRIVPNPTAPKISDDQYRKLFNERARIVNKAPL